MVVSNMLSSKGNKVPNQFIIESPNEKTFQSYQSRIAIKQSINNDNESIMLDEIYWNYSPTTSKYLALFLGVTNKELKANVKNGTYQLVNLN